MITAVWRRTFGLQSSLQRTLYDNWMCAGEMWIQKVCAGGEKLGVIAGGACVLEGEAWLCVCPEGIKAKLHVCCWENEM